MKCNRLSIFIPTSNEIKHIERCLKSAFTLTDHVYVLDSFSTDGTREVVKKMGAKLYDFSWTPDCTFAQKLNWGIEKIKYDTEWVMRLDADEYLIGDWCDELNEILDGICDDVNGVVIYRRLYFLGRWMRRRDNYPRPDIRIMRLGHAAFENRITDEHIDLQGGRYVLSKLELADNPILTIDRWIEKHNKYATLEALSIIDKDVPILGKNETTNFDRQTEKSLRNKSLYSKLPPYWRGFFYFCYRYFFKLGFLDGKEGFLWDFYHAWWYRNLVDTKVEEIYKRCGKDSVAIKKYILETYNRKLQ